MSTPLADQAARHTIRTATDRTLFVNAGAGSGKTRALVERVCQLVLLDGVRLRHVAAVTFTEKAGAELRDRLRGAFERVLRTGEPGEREAAGTALDDLDTAAIGTLHSFAQRILSEFPVEAGLPPAVEVLDEVGSSVAAADRWAVQQRQLLDAEELAEPLLLAMTLRVRLDQVRGLIRTLAADWDLIESHVLVAPPGPLQAPDLRSLHQLGDDLLATAAHCTDPEDRLLARIRTLEQELALLRAAPDLTESAAAIQRISALTFGRIGRAGHWPGGAEPVREQGTRVAAVAGELISQLTGQCLRAITCWAGAQVLIEAGRRRGTGQLEFHDLLVITRGLLRDNDQVRARLQQRYQRLLLDEFQDTDPIQVELAVRIAAGAGGGAERWQDVEVPPGRLFLVGDAKQSIYRFRRASITTYLAAEQTLGERQTLSSNFRTVPEVLDWVNTVFAGLIQEGPGQPRYEPLGPVRPGGVRGPAVTVLGAEVHPDKPSADELRAREAADVAAVLQQLLSEGWQVWDARLGAGGRCQGETGSEGGAGTERETGSGAGPGIEGTAGGEGQSWGEGQPGGWRAARRSDIAVLMPARTSLPFLTEALDAAGIPFRAEASSLVYQGEEVRELLACARAVADPSDELSLLTALRSPLFGCGDDDLFRWRHRFGRLRLWFGARYGEPASGPEEDPAVGPVGEALVWLGRLAREARWLQPSELLTRIVTERRMLEVAALGPRAREGWRRLRFVIDQARAWAEATPGGLRSYLAWAAFQAAEATRVAEAVLPETDVDAVHAMTVHAAKGLEFPIVVMSGMTSQTNPGRGLRLLWRDQVGADGGYDVRFGADVATEQFSEALPVDEQMDEMEKRRLLYVAATRARDHLVVSLHRGEGGKSTAARLLAEHGALTPEVARFVGDPVDVEAPGGLSAAAPPPEWAEWSAAVQQVQDNAARTRVLSASGLEGTEPEIVLSGGEEEAERDAAVADDAAAGAAKGPRDLELPPWSKGRHGSAVGRAVHGVLQSVDLTTGQGLDAAVAAQSLAEGVTEHQELVTSLVRSALASELVQRAAAREHWRESYVATVAADGTLVEGYVDLVFRDDDGALVVVDYKTDAVPVGALASRVTYYTPQLRAYRDCLVAASGEPVRSVLLFLHPTTSTEASVA